MVIRLQGPWQALTTTTVNELRAQLGVYAIRKPGGTIVKIGHAGARSLFGLRSELESELEQRPDDDFEFIVEVNMQYLSRYAELLMVHQVDFGELPTDNQAHPPDNLGRLSPAG
jgi:hypothetical protein